VLSKNMNQFIFAVSGLINFIVFLFISIFVLVKRKNFSNIIFSLLTFCTAFWSFGYWRWLLEYDNYDNAIFWLKFLTIGSIWIPVLFVQWISLIFKGLVIKKFNRLIFVISYIVAVVFTFFNFFTPLLVESVQQKLFFTFWPNAGPLYKFYILYYLLLTVYAGILLINYYGKTSGYLKSQIKYVTIACLIALTGGFFNFFLWFDILIPPYGNFIIPIYPILISYAIIKYRLMDIRFVISRSILYFILILTVALSFTFITFSSAQFFEGQGQIWVTLFVSLIIVIGLDPLKKLLSSLTDKFFFKAKIDYQDALRETGQILAKELDLEKLLSSLTIKLEERIKLHKVTFLILKNDGKSYENLDEQNKLELPADDTIFEFFKMHQEIVVTEEISRKKSDKKNRDKVEVLERLEKRLDDLKISLVVPIFSEEGLMGIFLIENKLSGSPFTQADLDFFEVLEPQVATALEKSKLFEEVQLAKTNLEVLVEQRTADLEERNKYLTALQTLINVITRSLDFKKVMQTIADGISKELGFIGGILSFINFEDNTISVGAISNTTKIQKVISMLPDDPSKFKVPLDDPINISVKAIKEKKLVYSDSFYDSVVPALPKPLAITIQKILDVKSVVAVPVYSEEKIIGAIDFVLKKTFDEITEVEEEMMKSLADQVGIVYRNLTLYNKIQKANEELKVANVRLKKLDEAKSEFLSIASHQLRTPLTGIKGYLSMILEGDFGKLPENVNNIIEDVFQNTDRLTRLVNIFLNVSRIESGRFELSKKDVNIVELIKEVVKELLLTAEKKELKLIFNAPQKVLATIKLDRDKIKDVLVNLVDNAIKYTPKGKVEVFLEEVGKAIKVEIKDTGIGIKKGEDQELFKKFVRGEGIAKINTGGSGLGLFIAKKIVEAHGGKIWAESKGTDLGSSFIFTLPYNSEE